MSGLIELTGLGDLLRLVGVLFWVLVDWRCPGDSLYCRLCRNRVPFPPIVG
jgi:hypothetical protein